jgi:hypothetical protein
MNQTTNTEPTIDQLKAHVAATAAPAKRPLKPLPNGRLKTIKCSEADFASEHAAVALTGTLWGDVLNDDFFTNHQGRLRVGDTIQCHVDDQSWFGRLLVRAVTGQNKTKVHVVPLEFHQFDRPVERPHDDAVTHCVEHRGPHLKWCVIKVAENKVVSDNHETKEAASGVIANIMRKVA